MNLTESIESAERIYKQILEDFFVSVYDEKNLQSHGIEHHRRVWTYARELLFIPFRESDSIPFCTPSKLIIACYLHDIGMSEEPGPKHGKHGMEICLRFLEENNLPKNDFRDVLEAIENHDSKDYTSKKGMNDLLTILSVADDLDAFGFAGIYRYAEIYLTRALSPEQIGYLILENSERRFENFQNLYDTHNFYVQKHLKRYMILRNFFIQYNKQVDSYDFKTSYPEGYCGFIQLIMLMIRNKMTLKDFFIEAETYGDDIIIKPFSDGLKSEILPANRNE